MIGFISEIMSLISHKKSDWQDTLNQFYLASDLQHLPWYITNLPCYITRHFLIFTHPGVFSSLLTFFTLYCRISRTNV